MSSVLKLQPFLALKQDLLCHELHVDSLVVILPKHSLEIDKQNITPGIYTYC